MSERLLMGRKESKQTNIPPDILMCGSRGWKIRNPPPPPPGKAQVKWVSIEICIWTTRWKMMDPLWILGKG